MTAVTSATNSKLFGLTIANGYLSTNTALPTSAVNTMSLQRKFLQTDGAKKSPLITGADPHLFPVKLKSSIPNG